MLIIPEDRVSDYAAFLWKIPAVPIHFQPRRISRKSGPLIITLLLAGLRQWIIAGPAHVCARR